MLAFYHTGGFGHVPSFSALNDTKGSWVLTLMSAHPSPNLLEEMLRSKPVGVHLKFPVWGGLHTMTNWVPTRTVTCSPAKALGFVVTRAVFPLFTVVASIYRSINAESTFMAHTSDCYVLVESLNWNSVTMVCTQKCTVKHNDWLKPATNLAASNGLTVSTFPSWCSFAERCIFKVEH